MQVHGQHPVDASYANHLGDKLGGNGDSRCPWTPVLARKSKVRNDGGNSGSGCSPRRVDHDQQFHQVLGRRGAGGLDDKRLPAADVLQYFDQYFAVAEAANLDFGERRMKNPGNVVREFWIRVARENCHCRRIHGFTSPDAV